MTATDEKFDLGALVEFRHSEVAKAWDQHFNGLFAHKHFLIFFLDENLARGPRRSQNVMTH